MTNELKRIPMPHLLIHAIEKHLGWSVKKSFDLDGTYEIRSKDCFLRLTEKEMGELIMAEVVEKMLATAYRTGKADGFDCGIEEGRSPV